MDIETKNKGSFLLSEWHHFIPQYDSFTEFIGDLKYLVVRCKECKTYYWKGCSKRCKCSHDEKEDII